MSPRVLALASTIVDDCRGAYILLLNLFISLIVTVVFLNRACLDLGEHPWIFDILQLPWFTRCKGAVVN